MKMRRPRRRQHYFMSPRPRRRRNGRFANDRMMVRRISAAVHVVLIIVASSVFPTLNILLLVGAQNANNYFCGTTWGDASNNCDERQHCPGATDEECMTPGHICFADTLCDASKGHGSGATLPYDHMSNTLFCQAGWGETPLECSVDLWCGDSWNCPGKLMCQYTSSCHLHDLIEAEEKKKAQEAAMKKKQMLLSMDSDDSRRSNSCGTNWSDASAKCGTWCLGEAEECPDGEACFADTLCHFDNGLVPSQSPTTYAPTTRAPTPRNDPSNFKFCGREWSSAQCSIEAHCPTGDECKKGEICHMKYDCNIHDLTESPTSNPTFPPILPPEHPMYFKYCGKTYKHAAGNCRLDTFCTSDADCVEGSSCYEGLPEYCNAFDLFYPGLRPTLAPTDMPTRRPITPQPTPQPTTPRPTRPRPRTQLPTASQQNLQDQLLSTSTVTGIPTEKPTHSAPTFSPTIRDQTKLSTTFVPVTKSPTVYDDPQNMRFCGFYWDNVDCSIESHCPTGTECRNGQMCFTLSWCNIHDLISAPLQSPPDPGPSKAPVSSAPVTKSPTRYDDPRNWRFCGSSLYKVSCSIESHCPTGLECKNGELCYTYQQCNIHDLTVAPSPNPTSPPVLLPDLRTNFMYCGKTVYDAINKCSLETHCTSNDDCQPGDFCYENLPGHCNYYYLVNSESKQMAIPTESPIRLLAAPEPTYQPSDPIPTYSPTGQTVRPTLKSSLSSAVKVDEGNQSLWCGKTQTDANRNCGAHSFWCVDLSCPHGWECFEVADQFCSEIDNESYSTTDPALYLDTTRKPTSIPTKMITSNPTPTGKKPTPNPITVRPTKQEQPILETISGSLISQPLSKTNSPSSKITSPHTPANSYETLHPTMKSSPDSSIQQPTIVSDPGFHTNKKPNAGKDIKPGVQHSAKDEEAQIETTQNKPSPAEEPNISTSNRLKLYCFTHMDNFDQDCPKALECSVGNLCPSGQFCVEHTCMNRSQPNASLDLCPHRYVGIHTKDCKTYYECDFHGYVGPTYSCEEGYKYDKTTDRCIFEHLVNSQCYRLGSFVPPSKPPITIINAADVEPIDPSDENDEVSTNIKFSPSETPSPSTSDMGGAQTWPPSNLKNPGWWQDSFKRWDDNGEGMSFSSTNYLPSILFVQALLLVSILY